MTVLVAPDSFKDALPALDVCRAIERGLRLADAGADIRLFPLADGGEGTADILTYHSGGRMIEVEVSDPLRRPVRATYGLAGDGGVAFIEMAQASGLQRLTPAERDPLRTTTYGTGEMIRHAVDGGARRILLGIGGSATNDCGIGLAAALGYRFYDLSGDRLEPVGASLERISVIDASEVVLHHGDVNVTVLCDVDNPLYGPAGAAYTYAAQKGADAAAIRRLDQGLRSFSRVLARHFGRDFAQVPGAGAAGGLGAGALAFLGAELRPGIATVLDLTNFAAELDRADLVITGEGRIDGQTGRGKLITGITRLTAPRNIPVIALCGALDAAPDAVAGLGLTAAFSIQQRPVSLEEALAATAEGLERTAFGVLRTWRGFRERGTW